MLAIEKQLTRDDIDKIMTMHKYKFRNKEIAAKFGVSVPTIKKIIFNELDHATSPDLNVNTYPIYK